MLASSKITSYQSSLIEIAAIASFLQPPEPLQIWLYLLWQHLVLPYASDKAASVPLWALGIWVVLSKYSMESFLCHCSCAISGARACCNLTCSLWLIQRCREHIPVFISSDPSGDALSTSSPKLRRGEQNRSALLRDPPRNKNLFPTLILFFFPLVEWSFYLVS